MCAGIGGLGFGIWGVRVRGLSLGEEDTVGCGAGMCEEECGTSPGVESGMHWWHGLVFTR